MVSHANTPSDREGEEAALESSNLDNRGGQTENNTGDKLSQDTTGSVATEINRVVETHPTQLAGAGRIKPKLAVQITGSDEDRTETARQMLQDENLMRDLTGHAPINMDPASVEDLISIELEDGGR